jgi:hypothetical protein
VHIPEPGLHILVMRDSAERGEEYEICERGSPECLGWVAVRLKRGDLVA